MKLSRQLLSFVLLFGLAVPISTLSAEGDKAFELRFGIVTKLKSGDYTMKDETTRIPRHFIPTGFRFGYLISERNGKPFRLETVTYPPSPPARLGEVFKNQDPKKGLRSLPREFKGKGSSGFGFDPGDPTGQWQMEFYVESKLFRTIEFTVYEPNEKSKPN